MFSWVTLLALKFDVCWQLDANEQYVEGRPRGGEGLQVDLDVAMLSIEWW
jgi:hypothetical protein